MSLFKAIYNRWFGENKGLEHIAQQLRSGRPYLKITDKHNMQPIYLRGTGLHISGTGNQRTYDIRIHQFNAIPTETSLLIARKLADCQILNQAISEENYTRFSNPTYLEGRNDPAEVMELLKKIASRLKPHQCYKLQNLRITNSIFSKDGIRFYDHNNREWVVPHDLIDDRYYVSTGDLVTGFDPAKVAVFDEAKIKREHRNDKDPKRWYELKQVESITDRHAFTFTHACTGAAPLAHYSLDIIIDAKNAVSKPFYVKEIIASALNTLNTKYPAGTYFVDGDTSQINITWAGETTSIDTYRDNQLKYPASVDKQPVLIYPELVVTQTYRGYDVRETD